MATTLQKPATRFAQTDRTGWVFTLTAKDIFDLLPQRQPEQLSLFTETNRPITSRHMEGIERFLIDIPNWAMPSITLAVTPGRITEKGKTISVDMEDLKILDGQHRTEAFAKLIHRWQLDAPRDDTSEIQKKLDAILAQELPAVIFEIKDNRDQRQLFAWFARNKPIEPAVREFFDESDPFGKAAKAAMEDSASLTDRVTYQKKSLNDKDRLFLTLSNLKDVATTMRLGIRRAPKAADRDACWNPENQAELQAKLVGFFDDFLPSCQPNYRLLAPTGDFEKNILSERSISHAFNPMVIRLLANTWAQGTNRSIEPDRLSEVIGGLNMRRADPLNDLENRLGVVQGDKKKFLKLRDPAWEAATKTLITEAQG